MDISSNLEIKDISNEEINNIIDDSEEYKIEQLEDRENLIENENQIASVIDMDESSSPDDTTDVNELGDANAGGFLYSILHMLDDLYVYGRTVIENNYFNLADNVDFNLVYPNVYIGNYSTSTNLELLTGLGITHILSVIPSFNPPFPEKFTYLHIPAYDDESQNLEGHFDNSVAFIHDVLQQGGKILIHCMVGRSRSVSMFIAFLISILQGDFDQSCIDTTIGADVSNEIEFRKFNRHIMQSQSPEQVDGIAVKYYNHDGDGDANTTSQSPEKGIEHGEISRLEYIKPQFINKYRNFMIYKKQTMLDEIEKIKEVYTNTSSNTKITADDIYTQLLEYVKKYREIACPNPYFKSQLINLL